MIVILDKNYDYKIKQKLKYISNIYFFYCKNKIYNY